MEKKTKAGIIRLEKRLDKLALKQLREVAAKQHARIEELQACIDQLNEEVIRLRDHADFWHEQATTMQLASYDENFSTHRSIGLTQNGEIVVVKNDE